MPFIAIIKPHFFIFGPRLMSLSMWGFGTVILNVVKVLDFLVALQQKSGRLLLSSRSPEFEQLTVKAFL